MNRDQKSTSPELVGLNVKIDRSVHGRAKEIGRSLGITTWDRLVNEALDEWTRAHARQAGKRS